MIAFKIQQIGTKNGFSLGHDFTCLRKCNRTTHV